MSIRIVARNYGFPLNYLKIYSANDIEGIPQNLTFSIGYKKNRQVSSVVFFVMVHMTREIN